MRVVCIVQARMGATRLPGKPLKQILGRPLLDLLVERLRRAITIDDVVIATSIDPKDDPIALWCEEEEISCYRGSQNDVLQRYLEAARIHRADVIVRITGDCPLTDPAVVDSIVRFYEQNVPEYDYVSNVISRTYPRGLDVEVFSLEALEKAAKEATNEEYREHVTLYFYENPDRFSLGSVMRKGGESSDRWTVDTPEDFTLVQKIFETLYPVNPEFHMQDVLDVLETHPEWRKINAHVAQKPIR